MLLQTCGFIPRKKPVTGWVVEPTHLKKYARQLGFIFPKVRGENKKKILELPPPRLGMLVYQLIKLNHCINTLPGCGSIVNVTNLLFFKNLLLKI